MSKLLIEITGKVKNNPPISKTNTLKTHYDVTLNIDGKKYPFIAPHDTVTSMCDKGIINRFKGVFRSSVFEEKTYIQGSLPFVD